MPFISPKGMISSGINKYLT